ncbi:unnamed protein product [Ilex paraguariensis]|uniref:Uncharacterized protein n=1 Tax=Ilex paraguariensis TaxID=185542 RepID=A0ABC8TXL4_9AQUA
MGCSNSCFCRHFQRHNQHNQALNHPVRTVKPLLASFSEPLFQFSDDDENFSDDETASSASFEDEEYESTSSSDDELPVDENFGVAGSSLYSENPSLGGKFKLRRRFSWSTLPPGKAFKASTAGGVQTQVDSSSNSIIFSAHDTRVGSQTPSIYASWQSPVTEVVSMNSGGVEKVYIRETASQAF